MSDMRLFNMPKAIANLADECVAAGVTPANVVEAVADGLGIVLTRHYQAEQAAALLRIQAGKIEMTAPRAPMPSDERELVDLARRAHEFINTLQVAGIEELVAVTVLMNTAVERVARTRGAAGAAHWLRSLASMVDKFGDAIEVTARSH